MTNAGEPVSKFIAKHFDELTAHELQQIHIIRSLVFTVGQAINLIRSLMTLISNASIW